MTQPLIRYTFTVPDGAPLERRVRWPDLWALTGKYSLDWALADARDDEPARKRYRELVGPDYACHPAYRDSILDGVANEDEYAARIVAKRLARVEADRLSGWYSQRVLICWGRSREHAERERKRSQYDGRLHDFLTLQGVPTPEPPSRSEMRLQAALSRNPHTGAEGAAWEAGVRYAFGVAYSHGKVRKGTYTVAAP